MKNVYACKPVNIQRVQYERSDIRRAITNVLDAILPSYKYTSLPELNAILKHYYILADRGKERSETFKNNGLLYRIFTEKGESIGIPIKASAIYNKTTMKFLSEKFQQNHAGRQQHKQRVKNTVVLAIIRNPHQTIQQLAQQLQKENIHLAIHQNKQGTCMLLT